MPLERACAYFAAHDTLRSAGPIPTFCSNYGQIPSSRSNSGHACCCSPHTNLDAAIAVFSEKGFHRATIKEMARVAGIADGTIYTYFASKDEVLIAVLDRLNETTERKQQFVLSGVQDLKAFFRAFLRQRMTLLWPNAEVFRVVLPELLVNGELRKQYYEQVLAPTIAIGEQFFQAQSEQLQINIPLTVRAIAGTLLEHRSRIHVERASFQNQASAK
jgi:AcrR family transcriptional regulator